MCDTLCASPESTAEHIMLFAKNSDRQRNEAQGIEYRPSAEHAPGSHVECTYVTIPQVSRTHAVLLSRPFWLWGAEMGANEHGVVAGNETVYAKTQPPEVPALTGMDLVRIALERAITAAEAVEVMTALLEQHGQGGDCGHMTPFYYNNGFMIADARDAFVLETVGREWMVERVSSVRTISNCYSMGTRIDRSSAGLQGLLQEIGGRDCTTLPDVLADREREEKGQGRQRRDRSTSLLLTHQGELRAGHFMGALRDHGPVEESKWNAHSVLPFGLCIHARNDAQPAQTTAAMVSELRGRRSVHWVTGTAAPCVSIFKPVLMDVSVPPQGPRLTGVFDAQALWWRHERLHRAALMSDFPEFLASICTERDALEAEFRVRLEAVRDDAAAEDRARVVAECWRDAAKMEDRWLSRLGPASSAPDALYRGAWSKMSRVAGMSPAT